MSRPSYIEELEQKLPRDLFDLLDRTNGAAELAQELPRRFQPREVTTPTDRQRAWELAGFHYIFKQRYYDAIPILAALYDHMLSAQEESGQRVHKGMPLVWLRDCYWDLGLVAHAKRYMMLTLCEDAIRDRGKISPAAGVYFRLVWAHGLADRAVREYGRAVFSLQQASPDECLYPERILQLIGHDWMTEAPVQKESQLYVANTRYISFLMKGLGDPAGRTLEDLATYILACIPGCRVNQRQRSHSTEYDLVCAIDGTPVDFRSEIGRYFLCECKDWNRPADFTSMAKLCRVLDSVKARFGILFSKEGITGTGKTKDAEREQVKVYQDRGMVIVVIDENDLERVAEGEHFINLLRGKYERVRLDLFASE